jgi:serine protease Do
VVTKLEGGDFESLGINGWAVFDDAAGVAGIWVAGVEAGSPAAKAKVMPGDIITTMNGLPVGQDGTYKDYCDVIRTASNNKPIAVEVLRWDSREVLRGEINGEDELEQAFSFAEQIEEETDVATAEAYSDYVAVTDDSGVLTVEVPTAWTDVTTTAETGADGNTFPQIAASTNLTDFYGGWVTPGMLFSALPASQYTVDQLLSTYSFGDHCTDGGVNSYDDGVFSGSYQTWENCGGTGSTYVVLVTSPHAGGEYTYLTAVQVVSSADLEALDHVFATFNTIG